MILTVVLIICISMETFLGELSSEDEDSSIYLTIQFWICGYFLLDFIVMLFLSQNKKRFFWRYFIVIFLSIPYVYLSKMFSISFSGEMTYLLRFIPVLRGGAALIVLSRLVIRNSITSLFISYIVLFFALIYFQTLIFYVFEAGVNEQIKSYYDVLWWASMTVTTVGSNIIAVTAVGKVSTAVLAVIGMTTLPIFTVYITSIMQRWSQSSDTKQELPKVA
ncbi:two pore domain potassium channel family protein [Alcaligenaceae bacterium]|nr:two pore domain potassium channel family protein [Alcaligenaceae bacterium]